MQLDNQKRIIINNKFQIASIGLEEGCPAEEPKELDAIIALPTKPSNIPPLAHPLSEDRPQGNSCIPEEQKQFGICVQPLTSFQPHPLAVIKQPKQIDAACVAYKEFNKCRSSLKCNPLWARGMSAMFEFACGPHGYDKFINVRFLKMYNN